jgi:hypothetical protein
MTPCPRFRYQPPPRVFGNAVYRVRVALKHSGRLKRFTTPVDELDRAQLVTFCDSCDLTPMTEIVPRTQVRVGGEVRSVRMVPRAGAPALEVTVSDGRGSATAVFLGRRKIAGVAPGRRMSIEGIAGRTGNRVLLLNPLYTLFP